MACLMRKGRERYILNIGNGKLRDCCCCDSNMYKMQVMQPDGTWQVSAIKGRWHRCEQRYECMPSPLWLLNWNSKQQSLVHLSTRPSTLTPTLWLHLHLLGGLNAVPFADSICLFRLVWWRQLQTVSISLVSKRKVVTIYSNITGIFWKSHSHHKCFDLFRRSFSFTGHRVVIHSLIIRYLAEVVKVYAVRHRRASAFVSQYVNTLRKTVSIFQFRPIFEALNQWIIQRMFWRQFAVYLLYSKDMR